MARSTSCKSDVNRSFLLCLAACRTRSSACDTLARSCARRVLCWSAFPLVPALGSTGSAADRSALFVGFPATTTESDSSGPCIVGYDSSSSRRGPAVSTRRPNPRPPGSRAKSFHTCSGSSTTPDWAGARVIALPMLPSVILTTSASGNIKLSRLDGWPFQISRFGRFLGLPDWAKRATHGDGGADKRIAEFHGGNERQPLLADRPDDIRYVATACAVLHARPDTRMITFRLPASFQGGWGGYGAP